MPARAESAARDAAARTRTGAHRELARARARYAAAVQARGFHRVRGADVAVAAEPARAGGGGVVGRAVEVAGRVPAVLDRLAQRRVLPIFQAVLLALVGVALLDRLAAAGERRAADQDQSDCCAALSC